MFSASEICFEMRCSSSNSRLGSDPDDRSSGAVHRWLQQSGWYFFQHIKYAGQFAVHANQFAPSCLAV